jgi:hypothetical protein
VAYYATVGKRDQRATVGEALTALLAEENPEEVLRLARALREAAESLELESVRNARERKVSWSRFGAIYGLTKQGAQQRFRRDAQSPAQAS